MWPINNKVEYVRMLSVGTQRAVTSRTHARIHTHTHRTKLYPNTHIYVDDVSSRLCLPEIAKWQRTEPNLFLAGMHNITVLIFDTVLTFTI